MALKMPFNNRLNFMPQKGVETSESLFVNSSINDFLDPTSPNGAALTDG
jgi:hypothetical protein